MTNLVKFYLLILGIIVQILEFILFLRDSSIDYVIAGIPLGVLGTGIVLGSLLWIWKSDPRYVSRFDRLEKHKILALVFVIGLFIFVFDLAMRKFNPDLVLALGGVTLGILSSLMIATSSIIFGVKSFIISRNLQFNYQDMDLVESPDAFISYSSSDVETAETLHFALIAKNINSWISTKNIDPGQQYGLQIVSAIDDSPFFILLVNRNSVESRHILTELERAFSHGSAIIPVLLEEVDIPKGWEYYLSTSQWMNVVGKNKKEWIDEIINIILENLSETEEIE